MAQKRVEVLDVFENILILDLEIVSLNLCCVFCSNFAASSEGDY